MKFRSLLLTVFLFALPRLYCLGQTQDSLEIDLSKVATDSLPFLRSRCFIEKVKTAVGSPDTNNGFERWSIYLQSDNYDTTDQRRIVRIDMDTSSAVKRYRIDANHNGQTSDEATFELTKNFVDHVIKDVSIKIDEATYVMDVVLGIQVAHPPDITIDGLKPQRFKPIEAGLQPIFRTGRGIANNREVKFAVFNYQFSKFTKQNSALVTSNAAGRLPSASSYPIKYRVGDTLLIGSEAYRFSQINSSGSKITLNVLDLPHNLGYETGYTANIPGLLKWSNSKIESSLKQQKFILIDAWGTWCAPCLSSTPALKEIFSSLDPNKVTMLSISYNSENEKVEKYFEKNAILWPNVLDESAQPSLISTLKIQEFPTFILLDGDQKIIAREPGQPGLEKIRKILIDKSLLLVK